MKISAMTEEIKNNMRKTARKDAAEAGGNRIADGLRQEPGQYGKETAFPGICYFNDYSPRYKEPYNIYEKAREHMKQLKNKETMRKQEKM